MGDVVDRVKGFAAEHGVAGELPEVRVSKVLLETAEEMGKHLARAPLFLRDGRPVVVCPEQHRIEEMGAEEFVTFADGQVKVVTMKRVEDEWLPVRGSLTKATAGTVLASKRFRSHLRELRKMALVRLPVMRESGEVELLPEGYDEESSIYTVDTLGDYEDWTLEQGKVELADLLGQFPFVLDEGEDGRPAARAEACHIMAMLNLFCCNMLPRWCSRPAFVFNANTQKTGKSLLAKMSVCAVTGTQVAETLPHRRADSGQLKQRLNSAALGGAPYIFFDNCEGVVECPELAAFVQAPQWGDRRMREQTEFVAENVTTCYLTGVDFTVGADMAQRCVFVDLFVEEGDASERRVETEIDETWLMQRENRRRILSALWALVKHWAQMPADSRPKATNWLPGFRSYAEVMGSIVMAAGYSDPFMKPPASGELDKTERDFLVLLAELVTLDEGEYTFPQILEVCRVGGLFAWFLPSYSNPDQQLNLGDVSVDPEVDQRQRVTLGKILAKRSEGSRVRTKSGQSSGRVYGVEVSGVTKRVRFSAEGASAARSRRFSVVVE